MNLIPVQKNGETIEVHHTTLADHKRLGWIECEAPESLPEVAPVQGDAFDAMSRDELKAFLRDKAIEFAGNTGDAKLRTLCRSHQG